jgi:hypothetical protein
MRCADFFSKKYVYAMDGSDPEEQHLKTRLRNAQWGMKNHFIVGCKQYKNRTEKY